MNLDHNIYSKTNIIKSSYLIFIIFIYITGFLWRENIAGAAETDFLKFTWPAVLSFKRDFIYSILNYGKFGEGSTPLFHIWIIPSMVGRKTNYDTYWRIIIGTI